MKRNEKRSVPQTLRIQGPENPGGTRRRQRGVRYRDAAPLPAATVRGNLTPIARPRHKMSWRPSSDIFLGGHFLCVITAYTAVLYFRTSSEIPAATPAAGTPVRSAAPPIPITPTAAPVRAPAAVRPPPLAEHPAVIPPTPPAAAAPVAAAAAAAIPAVRAAAAAAGAAITPQPDIRRLQAPYIPVPPAAGASFAPAFSCAAPGGASLDMTFFTKIPAYLPGQFSLPTASLHAILSFIQP